MKINMLDGACHLRLNAARSTYTTLNTNTLRKSRAEGTIVFGVHDSLAMCGVHVKCEPSTLNEEKLRLLDTLQQCVAAQVKCMDVIPDDTLDDLQSRISCTLEMLDSSGDAEPSTFYFLFIVKVLWADTPRACLHKSVFSYRAITEGNQHAETLRCDPTRMKILLQ